MKRNFLKFCFVGLGSVALLSACVEADNLDSIEQLQDVTAKAKLDQAKATEAQNRQALADKVYTLQTNVATLKGDILALEASENQIEFLSADYELQVAQQESELAGLQPLVAVLAQVKSSANYQGGIDSVSALLQVTAADYQKKNLAYEKALGLSNRAYEVYNNASNAYSDSENLKSDAANDSLNALWGYSSIAMLKLKAQESASDLAAFKTIVTKWVASEKAASAILQTASLDRDAKYADYIIKRSIVENAELDQGSASSAEITARDNAYTAYDLANDTYWDAYSAHDEVLDELNDAIEDVEDEQSSLDQLNRQVVKFNDAKLIYVTESAKTASLLAAKNSAEEEYLILDAKTDVALAARNAADNIASAQADLIESLQGENSNIDQDIYDLNSSINELEASIQANNDKIAQLAGGFNTNTSKLVAEWIAAANAKIAAYEAIIASYKI